MPLIQKEVAAHGWLAGEDLINFVAVSESTPGPFAINIATYIGSELGGQYAGIPDWLGSFAGALCATLGVVLPSLVVILLVAKFYLAFKNSRVVKGCMTGLRPVAVGLICGAALTIALEVFSIGKIELLLGESMSFINTLSLDPFTTWAFWCSVIICVGATVVGFKKVHPILIIVGSAVVGIGLGFLGVWG